MWGRKKDSEPDPQSQIATAAPASYWDTHPERDTDAVAPPADASRPRPSATFTIQAGGADGKARVFVNGKPLDLSNLHHKMIVSVGPDGRVGVSDLGSNFEVIRKAIEQEEAGGGDHLAELIPLIKKFARHEISPAEFETERARIQGH